MFRKFTESDILNVLNYNIPICTFDYFLTNCKSPFSRPEFKPFPQISQTLQYVKFSAESSNLYEAKLQRLIIQSLGGVWSDTFEEGVSNFICSFSNSNDYREARRLNLTILNNSFLDGLLKGEMFDNYLLDRHLFAPLTGCLIRLHVLSKVFFYDSHNDINYLFF